MISDIPNSTFNSGMLQAVNLLDYKQQNLVIVSHNGGI